MSSAARDFAPFGIRGHSTSLSNAIGVACRLRYHATMPVTDIDPTALAFFNHLSGRRRIELTEPAAPISSRLANVAAPATAKMASHEPRFTALGLRFMGRGRRRAGVAFDNRNECGNRVAAALLVH
jgi:hypothetical protein